MPEISDTRRLNKFINQNLIKILSTPGVEVRFIGNPDTLKCLIMEHATGYDPYERITPHVFAVNKYGKRIFEYRHSTNNVSVYVGDNCVANLVAPALGNADIQELKDALLEKIIQDKKAKQIEFDRKNLMINDIRALEFLKQFCNIKQ